MRKRRQPKFIQKESSFHQNHEKEINTHKKKEKRNKKMWKPRPIQRKDKDFLRPRRSVTLIEFILRSFLDGYLEEVLEVNTCHVVSIVEVENNYASLVDNSNETKQITSIFDHIKPSTTRSSIFQRLSIATKEEENQCPTSTSTST